MERKSSDVTDKGTRHRMENALRNRIPGMIDDESVPSFVLTALCF